MTPQQITQLFAEKFGSEPRLFFSPGRINLIGEHIDYNDGFVLPAAIDKGIWFALAPTGDQTASFYSADLNEHYTTNIQSVTPVKGWPDYLLGILDQLNKNQLKTGGFQCVFGGNLPVGAGLSSSAAVECGLLYGLKEIFDLQLHRTTMATIAQKAEHTFPGVKCGIMDQFANLMGKAGHALLLDCRSLDYTYYPLSLDDYTLMLINTRVHHSLAAGEYNIRRSQCAEGLAQMQKLLPGTRSFRDLTPGDVQNHREKLDDVHYKRMLFVTQEISRTQQAARLLSRKKLEEFGQLMYQAHDGLSLLYEVSCAELDFLVAQAHRHSDVLGSRMMGGGFGGCTLSIVRTSQWATVAQQITDAYKQAFGIEAEVYHVSTSDGTYEMTTG